MIIKSLTIENFRCYENEVFLFSKDANIILGQNNSGKSKLLDAFYWVLFDEVYNTEKKKWEKTNRSEDRIPCKRTKELTDDTLRTKVRLELEIDSDSKKYNKLSIERLLISQKINNVWNTNNSTDFVVTTIDKDTSETKIYDAGKAQDIINEYFPGKLRKYFFFQGEKINDLLSMSRRSDFQNALESLSKVEVFKIMLNNAKKVEKKLKNKFATGSDENEKNTLIKKDTFRKIEDLEKVQRGFEGDIKDLKIDINICKEKRDETKEQLSKFKDIRDVISNLSQAKEKKKRIDKIPSEIEEYHSESLINDWVFSGTGDLFNHFVTIYEDAKKKKIFPEPINKEYIEEMLQHETCLICSRDAKKGTEWYDHIKSHNKRASTHDDFEDYYNIVDKARSGKTTVENIDNQIHDFYTKYGEAEGKIESVTFEIKRLETELSKIKPKGVSEEDLMEMNFNSMMEKYQTLEADYNGLDKKISSIKARQEYTKISIKTLNDELNKLSSNEKLNVHQNSWNMSQRILEYCNSLHNTFRDELLNKIQKTTDAHYQEMTSTSLASPGRINIDFDNNEIFCIDSNGNKITDLNQGNLVSIQISIIAGILTVSNEYWNDNFPFIADAPTSQLGGNNKATAVASMINTFHQSIIILKDDVPTFNEEAKKSDPIRSLIKSNTKVGYSYELKIEKQNDGDVFQHTSVNKLKG